MKQTLRFLDWDSEFFNCNVGRIEGQLISAFDMKNIEYLINKNNIELSYYSTSKELSSHILILPPLTNNKKDKCQAADKKDLSTEKFKIIVGEYRQLPVILAWAMTIHKSQGLTIDRVHIDLGIGAFESGQTYVALSRCRTLKNLTLSKEIKSGDIKIDPEASAFYSLIRNEK
jgi:hypothetical protein